MTHRGFSHGASYTAAELRKALDSEPWEADDGPDADDGYEIRRVWLGTIFGITPSGKFYMPFACSNVAGDCLACWGTGTRAPRTGKRVRARAKARQSAFARRTGRRNYQAPAAREAYVKRVQAMRASAFHTADLSCAACDGLGSISAARDARWHEALEELATEIGAYVDHYDDSISIAESREALESLDEDESDTGT